MATGALDPNPSVSDSAQIPTLPQSEITSCRLANSDHFAILLTNIQVLEKVVSNGVEPYGC